ncbi:MAG: FecR family protein [Chloroflexi bacterium]|nr:FecR family protein [Chloroflexota bacterium]MCL5074040.1 FecR family protein [Chloroflexota bacterium]
MPRNPERLAWAVLCSSFFTLCLITTSLITGINWYLSNAMDPRQAKVEILSGTVLRQAPGAKVETNATSGLEIGENDTIRTATNSQAIIWLFDGSNVRLWPETSVTIVQLRSTRYNLNSMAIALRQQGGHTRFEIAPPSTRARSFEVETPQASMLLREGSYSIEIIGETTYIVTHYGSASVTSAGKTVELLQRERTEIGSKHPPRDPQPAARDLLINSNFTQGNDGLTGWLKGNREQQGDVPGDATVRTEEGRNVLRFTRLGSEGKHVETFIRQDINKDVTDFQSLKLTLDLKLLKQSLSGGGILGSEYPLLVRIRYRDMYQSEASWIRGFYFQNKDNYPTWNGKRVPEGRWDTFEADLFDPDTISPRPAYILWIEIAASGHDFVSETTNVRLVTE